MLVLNTTSPDVSPDAPAATPRYQVPSSSARMAFIGSPAIVTFAAQFSGDSFLDTTLEALREYVRLQSHSGLSDKTPQDARPHRDAAPGTRLPIDIRRFPWIRRLAADYAFDHARVADFFAGNPADPSAWRDAIARTQRHSRQRDRLVPLLHAQQHARAAHPAAIAAASELGDPKSVAIVTGQQAGLFGGPLFTLLKALTAIHLAERVRTEHQVPAVAVFWIDAED